MRCVSHARTMRLASQLPRRPYNIGRVMMEPGELVTMGLDAHYQAGRSYADWSREGGGGRRGSDWSLVSVRFGVERHANAQHFGQVGTCVQRSGESAWTCNMGHGKRVPCVRSSTGL